MILDVRYIYYQKLLACADYRRYKSKRVLKSIGKLCTCQITINNCFKNWVCFSQMSRHIDEKNAHAAGY